MATIVENWELVPEPEFSEKRPIYHLVRSHAGAGIVTLRNERNRRESKTQSDAEFRFLAEVVCRKEANASVEMTKTGLKSGFVSRAARSEAKQGKPAKKTQVYPLRYMEDFFAKTDEVTARASLRVAEDTFESRSNTDNFYLNRSTTK